MAVLSTSPREPLSSTKVQRELVRRASQPGYQWWLTHVMSAAACSHPVRLKLTATWHGDDGRSEVEPVTDGMPDGVLYAACKNRRATVCPACAETYRADTYQLVKAGLVGGKGVPDTVSGHPCFFVTLTAPAFGPVHTRVVGSNGTVRPCRARRLGTVCEHGRQVICLQRHTEDDPRLGEAICRDCYDYQHQAVWNFHAGELWRRTTITLNRKLRQAAQDRGVHVRLSYAKVAEYQRRGVVHFHALVRLDGYDPDNRDAILPPHPSITPELLASYLEHAATVTRFTTASHPKNRLGWVIRWGEQIDIRPVRLAPADTDDRGHLTTTAVAAYLAKYATKATEQAGHVSRRLTATAAAYYAEQDTHQARQLIACWQLGQRPFYRDTKEQRAEWADTWGKLQKWAHMLGFGGHFSTKSRRYSTTLTALRAVRKAYQRGEPPEHPGHVPADADLTGDDTTVTLTWLFDGVGWLTIGDAALANTAAAKARERKQIAKEEMEELVAG
ncbi:replication initiator [Prauserella muralis]|uniref:Uncharacterized protein n=1 Tax=Prauserella muralis TaxID=588067 RepID=A0A2V4AKG1_9PSEU|nr:replication initiator [Prauserella muralis]PXY20755.1 hypothetical protein BAY60_24860 [Prauserella muralis]TWE29768.1 hypothetical protein FHX69_2457 [Prauserella muralis]